MKSESRKFLARFVRQTLNIYIFFLSLKNRNSEKEFKNMIESIISVYLFDMELSWITNDLTI